MQMDLKLDAPLSVSELTRRIKESLEDGFSDVWVQGEITNLRVPSSGHMYFTLKDAGAQARAVYFRRSNRFLKFRPTDGLEVILRGRVSVYESRGEYQIIVEYMEPKGLGALQLAFLQLKDKLGKEGLFDPAKKRPLGAYPRSVGIVTSPTGAAVRDMLKVLKRRAPGIRVVLAPASVQGEAAPYEIAQAIAWLNEYGGMDAIIVGRGGGSPEDLAAFNTELVARAISASAVPVISAVGHETDFTIADFVADMRAPTPSVAAEVVARSESETRRALFDTGSRLVNAARRELRHMRAGLEPVARALKDPRKAILERSQRTDDLVYRLARAHRHRLRYAGERLALAMNSLMYVSPRRDLPRRRDAVAAMGSRLRACALTKLGVEREALGILAARLTGFAPLAPLARGFSITSLLPGMQVLKDARDAAPGDMVRVRLYQGRLDCRVDSVLDDDTATASSGGKS
jgi:exodeoxyribonuclease VII large subunit